MGKAQSLIKDIFNVMFSNCISLVSSVITGFIIPKILGATDYGYYRIFVLYITYTALLHFGFVDGILLKDGGKNYNDLDKYKYRSNSIVFITLQFLIAILFCIISIFITNKIYSLLLVTIGIGTFLLNVTTYYRFVSQISMRFTELSIRNIIQSVLTVVLILLVFVMCRLRIIHSFNYSIYIWTMITVYFIMFMIYISSYRDITFGPHDSLKSGCCRVIKYCKAGIFLTISSQISGIIMIIDNQFVSIFFSTNTYGKYSFSYSMISTALTILSAVATVLLPHLKRDTTKHMIKIYHIMISYMMLAVYFVLLAYFPLYILIRLVLPDYTQSLSYLRIFLPELGITCSVTMITFNYYNALGKSKFYFYISVIVLFISFIIDSALYLLFHNPLWIANGSFISIFIWYMVSEYFLVKWYHVKWIRNFIYMIIMITIFLLISLSHNIILGFIMYLISYLVVSLFMFKGIIFKFINFIVNRFKYEF